MNCIYSRESSRNENLYSPSLADTNLRRKREKIHNNARYIDAMFIHASHGYENLNNKRQTQWLSDTTQISDRVTWLCCQNGVHVFGLESFCTLQYLNGWYKGRPTTSGRRRFWRRVDTLMQSLKCTHTCSSSVECVSPVSSRRILPAGLWVALLRKLQSGHHDNQRRRKAQKDSIGAGCGGIPARTRRSAA